MGSGGRAIAATGPPRTLMRRPRLGDIGFLLAIACFVGWYLLLGPTVIGGPATYVWVSGVSMEPTLETGDLVIVRRADAYARGDIVAFKVPEGQPGAGSLVIHRIVGGSAADGYVTRGDNKRGDDPWRPAGDDLVGSAWLVAPGAGHVVTWLRDPMIFAPLAAALTVVGVLLARGGSGGSPAAPRDHAAPGSIRWARVGRSRERTP